MPVLLPLWRTAVRSIRPMVSSQLDFGRVLAEGFCHADRDLVITSILTAGRLLKSAPSLAAFLGSGLIAVARGENGIHGHGNQSRYRSSPRPCRDWIPAEERAETIDQCLLDCLVSSRCSRTGRARPNALAVSCRDPGQAGRRRRSGPATGRYEDAGLQGAWLRGQLRVCTLERCAYRRCASGMRSRQGPWPLRLV